MFWSNEHKLEVCEIFNDQIVSGPGVLDYPRAGYFLPVEYKYDEIDPLTQEYAAVTPEILPDRVLYHFKPQVLPSDEQLARLTEDSKSKVVSQRKAATSSPVAITGTELEIAGDLDTQYEIVRLYDGSLTSEDSEFVIPTTSGNAIVGKDTLKLVAKAITTHIQESFARQRVLEDKLGTLNTLTKIKKFRDKELS